MSVSRRFSFITARPYWWIYAIGIVLLLLSGWLWWTKIHLGTERVFWGMVEQSLSTRGVTMEIAQDTEGTKVRQLIQMELGATNRAHSVSTLVQGTTEIKTEVIGTRDADYTRYRDIKTDQKNAAGEPLDISKVLNVWSKSDDTPQTETQQSGHQLFAQSLLGIGLPVGTVPIPIGEVGPKARDSLLRRMQDQQVYDVSFDDVQKRRKDGRLEYVYPVKIQPILYVQLMKDFAKQLGLHELDMVDPNSYQSAQPLEMKLVVSAHARQLVGVENGQQGFKQTYQGYDVPLTVSLPKDPISSAELQQRLSEL